jgi:putative hydrolase of the HAD superfamily
LTPTIGYDDAMKKPDIIFLDAAGTLIRVRGSIGEVYTRIARKHGAIADSDSVEKAFRQAFRTRSLAPLSSGKNGLAAEKSWWRDVVKNAFENTMDPDTLNAYFAELFEFFRSSRCWELFPDALSCLRELKGLGYRLAIVSNFDSRLFDLLANLDIDTYFERVVLSWHVGVAKPNPVLFRRALEASWCDASRALHIGDDEVDDVQGAQAAGVPVVLIDRAGRHTEFPAERRIRSLMEILDLLK